MAFDLKSMLVRFLQIYRLDPDTLDQILLKEADEFEKRDPGAFAWDTAASDSLASGALFDSAKLREQIEYLVSLFPDVPERRPPDDFHYRMIFSDLGIDLDRVAEAIGTNQRGKEFETRYFQILRDQAAKERQRKIEEPRNPDLAVYFAWDFVNRLDMVVRRAQGFERVDYVLSGHLHELFQEAHRCYLFGYGTACLVLCGAILEECIRQRTGKTSRGLGDAIELATTDGILTAPYLEKARNVMRIRNTAAHGSPLKHRNIDTEVQAALINTRTVVNALFTTTGN
jgi:hypothetical protein